MEKNTMLKEMRANALEHIKTCDLIINRMRDQWCLALPEDGAVYTTTHGITMFPVAFGNVVQHSSDKAKVQGLLDHLLEMNPDNGSVARLKVMGWKKAARRQRANSTMLLEKLDELEAKEA